MEPPRVRRATICTSHMRSRIQSAMQHLPGPLGSVWTALLRSQGHELHGRFLRVLPSALQRRCRPPLSIAGHSLPHPPPRPAVLLVILSKTASDVGVFLFALVIGIVASGDHAFALVRTGDHPCAWRTG